MLGVYAGVGVDYVVSPYSSDLTNAFSPKFNVGLISTLAKKHQFEFGAKIPMTSGAEYEVISLSNNDAPKVKTTFVFVGYNYKF